MKIAYIIRSLAQPAGTERIMTDKMNYLSEKFGYSIYAITYEQGNHKLIFPLSPKIKHIDLNTKFYTLRGYNKFKLLIEFIKTRYLFAKRLKKNIKEIRPDIIICTTYSDFLIDLILNMHIYSKIIIEAHVSKASIEYKHKWRYSYKGKILGKIIDNYIEKKIKHSSALVTLTQQDAKTWEKIKRAVVIPNLVTYFPPTVSAVSSSKEIISVGRLDRQKGYDLLLEAWTIVQQKHQGWKLNIYGGGSELQTLQNIIQKNHFDHTVTIHKPTKNIYNKYLESAFYVLSSRYEGFGLVLVEAMSCGLPCISFDCPNGPAEIITDQVDGFLVENGNINKLAQEICFLIENEDKREQMGREARKKAKKYLPENIMPQWIYLFGKVINE